MMLIMFSQWLQSKERQAELFDEVMVRYRYDFLPNLSQLVLLSVSAAVSVKFEHKVMERLSWLEGVLAVLDPMVSQNSNKASRRIMANCGFRIPRFTRSVIESWSSSSRDLNSYTCALPKPPSFTATPFSRRFRPSPVAPGSSARWPITLVDGASCNAGTRTMKHVTTAALSTAVARTTTTCTNKSVYCFPIYFPLLFGGGDVGGFFVRLFPTNLLVTNLLVLFPILCHFLFLGGSLAGSFCWISCWIVLLDLTGFFFDLLCFRLFPRGSWYYVVS